VETAAQGFARGEAELDRLIERRSRKGEMTPDEEEYLWQTSVQRHAAKLREAARVEWTLYHEHMSELHLRLSQEHAQKAERLCEDDDPPAAQGEGVIPIG
jgi:hypothetical protein